MKAQFNGIIQFDVTDKCNFKCAHCYGYFGGNMDYGMEMKKDEFLSSLKEFHKVTCDEGVKVVSFFGGEPTLHPDIFTFIETTSRLRMMPMLTTNAWWGHMAHDYAKRLKEVAIGGVALSCDIYHLQFNTWEKIKAAYDELKALNIIVCINWASSKFIFSKEGNCDIKDAIEEIKPFIPIEDIDKYLVKPEPKNYIGIGYLGRAQDGLIPPQRMWDMMMPGVPKLIHLNILPGYRFSLNCSYNLPFSVYDYEEGKLIETVTNIQEEHERVYPQIKQTCVRACFECDYVMSKIRWGPNGRPIPTLRAIDLPKWVKVW